MILHGPDHRVSVRIRITIAAEVAPGVIRVDIPGDIAGTLFPVIRVTIEGLDLEFVQDYCRRM